MNINKQTKKAQILIHGLEIQQLSNAVGKLQSNLIVWDCNIYCNNLKFKICLHPLVSFPILFNLHLVLEELIHISALDFLHHSFTFLYSFILSGYLLDNILFTLRKCIVYLALELGRDSITIVNKSFLETG